jgi:hypothetical protein
MSDRGFTLWLEFEQWERHDDDDPEKDFFNMHIRLPSGDVYALNVWTFNYLSQAVAECRESGEHLDGQYLPPPDLFVARLDRHLIEQVVFDLIANDGLREDWLVRDD